MLNTSVADETKQPAVRPQNQGSLTCKCKLLGATGSFAGIKSSSRKAGHVPQCNVQANNSYTYYPLSQTAISVFACRYFQE